jgi:hypothetical protein
MGRSRRRLEDDASIRPRGHRPGNRDEAERDKGQRDNRPPAPRRQSAVGKEQHANVQNNVKPGVHAQTAIQDSSDANGRLPEATSKARLEYWLEKRLRACQKPIAR